MAEILDANGNAIEEETVQEAAPVEDVPVAETTTEAAAEEVDPRITESKENAKKSIDTAEHGYLVAILPDGGLTFQQIGSKQHYIELLGLHQFAKYRIDILQDSNQQYGAALIASQMSQIGQMLQVILNMLTGQSKQQLAQSLKR